jgi:hypothetical protein
MKSRSRRSAASTSTSKVAVSPDAGGAETMIRPFSTLVSSTTLSASALAMPRSSSFLNTAAGGSICTTSCSPVGCFRIDIRQFRGLPSTFIRNGAARASRTFGATPQSALRAVTAAWPASRLALGASTHASFTLPPRTA